jgi:hypothetical protein
LIEQQAQSRVAVLFARADSVYKTLPGVDVYDMERDARTYDGPWPVVAHPPCTRWSLINGVVLSRYPHKAKEFAWGNDGGTFQFALDTVRRCGGVLEHPAGSRAWRHFGLPQRGRTPDKFGGWTVEIRQCDWGHRAQKRTWLYIVGAGPDDLPAMPPSRQHTAVVVRMPECRTVEIMGKAEREHTPPALAAWLVDLAGRCSRQTRVSSSRQVARTGWAQCESLRLLPRGVSLGASFFLGSCKR